MIVWPAGVNRTKFRKNIFSILLDYSFIELPGSNLKIKENKNLFNFYEHT